MSFEHDVLAKALDKLLNGRHFCITDMRNIGDLINVNVYQHPNYKWLHALHCVDYSEMTQEVRDAIPHKVMECLDPKRRINPDVMARALLIEGDQLAGIEDDYLKLN